MPGETNPGIMLGGRMKKSALILQKIIICLNTVAEAVLVLMMMLTVVDVVLRAAGKPMTGTYELVATMGAMVIGLAIPKTSWDRGHVYVDFLIENRAKAVKNAFFIGTRLLGIVIFVLISWNLILKGIIFYDSGEVSLTLRMPFYPAAFALSLCFCVQSLSLIGDILRINESKPVQTGEPL